MDIALPSTQYVVGKKCLDPFVKSKFYMFSIRPSHWSNSMVEHRMFVLFHNKIIIADFEEKKQPITSIGDMQRKARKPKICRQSHCTNYFFHINRLV